MTYINFTGLVLVNESRELKGGKENRVFKRILKGTTESGAALDLVITAAQLQQVTGRDGSYAEIEGRVGVDYKGNIEFTVDHLEVMTKTQALQKQLDAEKEIEAKSIGNGKKTA